MQFGIAVIRSAAFYFLLTTFSSFFCPHSAGCFHGVRLRKIARLPKSSRFRGSNLLQNRKLPTWLRFPLRPTQPSLPLNRRQSRRAGTEGNGRFTKPDRRNFFIIARGSVQECVPLLELASRRDLITQEDHESLKSNLEEIAMMLGGLIKGIDDVD